jgi:hypothetical protein
MLIAELINMPHCTVANIKAISCWQRTSFSESIFATPKIVRFGVSSPIFGLTLERAFQSALYESVSHMLLCKATLTWTGATGT